MRGFIIPRFDDIDYTEEDVEFFDDNIEEARRYATVYGDNALVSLRRDLEHMYRDYKRLEGQAAKDMAAKIVAQTIILEDIYHGN